MNTCFNGIVFRGKSVSVKAYREKHIVALKPSFSRNDLKTRISLDVSYMHTCTRRIRELYKSVKFGLIRIVNGIENALVIPFFLPFFFCLSKIIIHNCTSVSDVIFIQLSTLKCQPLLHPAKAFQG